MNVYDRIAKVLCIGTEGVAVTAFEDVPFAIVPTVHEERDSAKHRLHEVDEAPPTLLSEDVDVIRHDRIRNQSRIAPLWGGTDDRLYRALQPTEAWLSPLRPGRQVKDSAGHVRANVSSHAATIGCAPGRFHGWIRLPAMVNHGPSKPSTVRNLDVQAFQKYSCASRDLNVGPFLREITMRKLDSINLCYAAAAAMACARPRTVGTLVIVRAGGTRPE